MSLLYISNVDALSCSSSEAKDLNTVASYVKASYELIDRSEQKEISYNGQTKTYTQPNYSFEITIYNISKEIYVKLKNDIIEEDTIIDVNIAKDGNYTFANNDFGRIYKYTIDIMSANENCYGQKVKTITLIKPKYNAYSEYTYCSNSSNYYCQKFTTKELNIKDDDDFFKKIKVNNSSNLPTTTTTKTPVISIIKDNIILYASVFACTVLICIGILIVLKKRRAKKRGEL